MSGVLRRLKDDDQVAVALIKLESESTQRAQLHQLPAKQRAVEAAAAAATLKAYERQEEALRAQASQQLAATPEVSGMALGSGGRPLPMHLDVPAGADAQAKSQQAKMLALFDRLSPQTQHLLLQQKSGLSLQEAAAATERQIQVCLEPPPFILILRVARRWRCVSTSRQRVRA